MTPVSLEEVEAEWAQLASRCARTPFAHPAWLFTWWRHFGSGHLSALALRNGATLTDLLPAFVLDWNGKRQLTLLGTGITDYTDPLIEPVHAAEFAARLLRDPEWEVAVWQDLGAQSPFADQAIWPGCSASTEPGTPCSSIPIGGTFEQYLSKRGKDLRRNLRRYTERAEREAPVDFACCENYSFDTLETVIKLHTARWRAQGEAGMVEANRSATFLHEMARAMSDLGALRVFTLRWQGQIVAGILGLLWNNALSGYLSAFAPEYEQLGFGRILLHRALEYAWQQGWSRWDFLRGTETYKAQWGAISEPKLRLTVMRS